MSRHCPVMCPMDRGTTVEPAAEIAPVTFQAPPGDSPQQIARLLGEPGLRARLGAVYVTPPKPSEALATALALRGAEPPGPVDVPATVLWGARDPIFPVRMSRSLPELFPRGTVRVLDDVGHFVPLEAAAEVAEAVREHLGATPAAGHPEVARRPIVSAFPGCGGRDRPSPGDGPCVRE